MKESPMIIVFAAPVKNRNDFSFKLKSSELTTEEWPEPMPGRKEKKGVIKKEAKRLLISSFFSIFIFLNG